MSTNEKWIRESIHISKMGKPKILCVHGFIGSPFDFKPLIDLLEDRFDIFIPKLELPRGDGKNTYLQVENHFQKYQPEVVIGFSMGGAITMQLPSCPKVIIAPYQGLPYGNKLLSNIASSLGFLNPKIPKLQSGRIKSKSGRKKYKPGKWSFSTSSFIALQNLVNRSHYTEISHPLLWIHSPKDPVACYKKAQKRWEEKSQHLIVENAEHVLLYEEEIGLISREITRFLIKSIGSS